MYKRSLIAASLSVAALVSAQAMAVTGGGASLPAELYKGSADSILPANFSYAVTGSGTGKNAFLTNNSSLFGTTGTVHYAGSDSILSTSELNTYNTNYNNTYGPLIQIPSVATSVTVPYKKSGITNLNLTSAQLCDAFSGAKSTWGQLLGTSDNTPIRIVYRSTSSGTSELFTRHLNAVCPTKFATNSTFTAARLPANGALPSHWVGVAETANVLPAVDAADGSIGYVSPDVVNVGDNARIARVNNNLPSVLNVQAALGSVAPPATTADRKDPSKWVPVFANPTAGYSIVGYTNFVFGQCYKVASVSTDVRAFINKHYGGTTTNAAVGAHGFIPLPTTWKNAIISAFYTGTSENLAIGNTNVCNTKGRP
ncbi:TPA: protein disulfide reductase [Pseudomonas aeruginosa]|uniref:substrate-binding domain-containing protein n=1 Tax=Pseudomonas aeruginosa TaxID=287 RepID=UPI0010682E59|nr:substrate-binding domain-containing protein [Pseudomonas aeruginosa]TER10310.1 protein disulfide reductase [Pseudomonas aeruginosa]HBP5609347.1 protein disulfide reductase [Pseudomonas aeruginosa]HCK3344522.1 substrate-binding domain-containing protein [Pseudomonas aeruginosa]HCK3354937.1 substrate-binding domain-containing protein [Pseudomonas aeruginosa]